jgi:hypothetical protein
MPRKSVTIATTSSAAIHQQAIAHIPTEMLTVEINVWPATNNGKIKEHLKK